MPLCIVGLGNPGLRYENTRHNVGFMVAEKLCEKLAIRIRPHDIISEVARGSAEGIDWIIVKPLTYMNESGRVVRRVVDEFEVPFNRLLVVSDDVALPLGAIRARPEGSHGGHNGLRSVIEYLGTEVFPRLRCGVGADQQSADLADFVLSGFRSDERDDVERMIDAAADAARDFGVSGIQSTMNKFNSKP